ncbi:MAG: DUF4294 domain-containing protein [Bacteroidales bacterium]
MIYQKHIYFSFLLLIFIFFTKGSFAQITIEKTHNKDAYYENHIMQFFVDENKDTVFISNIPPTYIRPKLTGKEKRNWRKYYKMIYNFSKTYPYALLARESMNKADNHILENHLTGLNKESYLKEYQKKLFNKYGHHLRHLTFSQGKMLLRLIDRELGITAYYVVKMYRGTISAGFWQGVARIVGSDMKKPYDKFGHDKELERIVKIYQKGEFDALYYSIFHKSPTEPPIESKYHYPQNPKNNINTIQKAKNQKK